MNRKRACCITGSFPENEAVSGELREALQERILWLINELGVRAFLSGMRPGIEQMAAEIVIGLRESCPDIQLECVLEYEEVYADWTEPERDYFFSIMERCDEETLLSYRKDEESNDYFINYLAANSDYVLAVFNDADAQNDALIWAARENHRGVFLLDPDSFTMTPNIKLIL